MAWLACADSQAMRLSEKGRADMVTKFKLDNGNYLIPIELPGKSGKRTPEEEDAAKALIEGAKQEHPEAFVTAVKWGWRMFKAIVIEGNRELYETIVHEEDVVQKRKIRDDRCIISDGNGRTIRCPLRLPNPEYDPNKPTGEGNRKTIKNSCDGCPYNTFDRPDFTNQSLESMVVNSEEHEENIPARLKTEMQSDAERYDSACKEILDFIAEKYLDKLPDFTLRLSELSRSEIAKTLGKNTSSLYKMSKGLKQDLFNLLDSLWYLDINR